MEGRNISPELVTSTLITSYLLKKSVRTGMRAREETATNLQSKQVGRIKIKEINFAEMEQEHNTFSKGATLRDTPYSCTQRLLRAGRGYTKDVFGFLQTDGDSNSGTGNICRQPMKQHYTHSFYDAGTSTWSAGCSLPRTPPASPAPGGDTSAWPGPSSPCRQPS